MAKEKEKTKAELEEELASVYETLEEKNALIKKLQAKQKSSAPVAGSKAVQH